MVTLDQAGCGRPGLQLIAPPADLGEVVDYFWRQRPVGNVAPVGNDASAWRIVADDAPCVIWQVRSNGTRLRLVGARTKHVDIDVSDRRLTVGARLRPGAIPALVGPAADAFTDRSYALEEIVGREAVALRERLAEGRREASVLAGFLRGLQATGAAVDPRLAWLASAEAMIGGEIDAAVRTVGLAPRTVRHLARRHWGMGLKRLWRIRRLHRALELGLREPDGGWARAAVEAGYADQAHLTRECRALLGEPPGVFAARGAARA